MQCYIARASPNGHGSNKPALQLGGGMNACVCQGIKAATRAMRVAPASTSNEDARGRKDDTISLDRTIRTVTCKCGLASGLQPRAT